MNMGYVFAFFGLLLAVGIALPGLLLAWVLWVPAVVTRARARFERPWRCFGVGVGAALVTVPEVVVAFGAASGWVKLLGWVGMFLLLTLASVGAAGLVVLMGERLGGGMGSSPWGFVRGAVVLELAVVFPLVGWFVLFPIVTVCALGAAVGSLRAGRVVSGAPVAAEVAHGVHTA